MWYLRKRIKVANVTPGMHLDVGHVLFMIRSTEDLGATMELALQRVGTGQDRDFITYITLDKSLKLSVNIK